MWPNDRLPCSSLTRPSLNHLCAALPARPGARRGARVLRPDPSAVPVPPCLGPVGDCHIYWRSPPNNSFRIVNGVAVSRGRRRGVASLRLSPGAPVMDASRRPVTDRLSEARDGQRIGRYGRVRRRHIERSGGGAYVPAGGGAVQRGGYDDYKSWAIYCAPGCRPRSRSARTIIREFN